MRQTTQARDRKVSGFAYKKRLSTWCRKCEDTTPHSLIGPQTYLGEVVWVVYGCDLCHDTKAIPPRLAREGQGKPPSSPPGAHQESHRGRSLVDLAVCHLRR